MSKSIVQKDLETSQQKAEADEHINNYKTLIDQIKSDHDSKIKQLNDTLKKQAPAESQTDLKLQVK